jgi:hypothetical protein
MWTEKNWSVFKGTPGPKGAVAPYLDAWIFCHVSMQVYLQHSIIIENLDSKIPGKINEIPVLKPATFCAQLPSWALKSPNWQLLTITTVTQCHSCSRQYQRLSCLSVTCEARSPLMSFIIRDVLRLTLSWLVEIDDDVKRAVTSHYRQLTSLSSTSGYRPWYHGDANG